MPLGLRNLDPKIAEQVGEMIAYFRSLRDASVAPTADIKRAGTAWLTLQPLVNLVSPVVIRLASFALAGPFIFFFDLNVKILGLLAVFLLAELALLLDTASWPTGQMEKNRLHGTYLAIPLRLVGQSEGEKAYAKAAAELIESETALGKSTARDLLETLTDLLNGYRRLTTEQERVRQAMTQSLDTIETEHERLAARLRTMGDPQVRETLAESLAMREKRRERARTIAPLLERIEAQREAILQVMRSVQSTAAGVERMPATASDFHDFQETVRRLRQRARAIDEAVQEVAAPGG